MNHVKPVVPKRKAVKKPAKKSLKARLFRAMLFVLGLLTGLAVPWYFYINYITDTIVKDQWEIPSVVYARPLELYQGKVLTPEALTFELDLLGYQLTSVNPGSGQYRIEGERFQIHSKGFDFPDFFGERYADLQKLDTTIPVSIFQYLCFFGENLDSKFK